MPDLNKIIEDLSSLTVAEAAELSKQLEEKWGVTPMAAAAPAAAGGAAPAEDKDDFTIMLVSAGDKKINVIKEAVTNAKSGQVEIRNDKDGNIGVSIGKKAFSDDQLLKNYNAILEALEKEKSNNTLKGDLIRSVFATSTMGVSYKVKLGKSI